MSKSEIFIPEMCNLSNPETDTQRDKSSYPAEISRMTRFKSDEIQLIFDHVIFDLYRDNTGVLFTFYAAIIKIFESVDFFTSKSELDGQVQ